MTNVLEKNKITHSYWFEKRWFYRLMESVPAICSWSMLLGPLILAFFYPELVAIWVIVFDLYWLFKAVDIGYRLYTGFRRLNADMNTDYMAKLRSLTNEDISDPYIDWRDIYHVVLLPSYNEGEEIIIPSLESYLKADYPKDRLIVVLALEERAGAEANRRGDRLKEKYRDKFGDFLVFVHPDGVMGELKGKSANATYAAKQLIEYFVQKKIPFENVILSNFDCDTRAHAQYFANITYKYLTIERRTHKTYQPIPIFNNNIWEVPWITRTIAISCGFWQMVESTRSYRMVNFSSQAMSFQTLIEIDFWDVTIVSEDSRQYYRMMYRYAGDHEVIPIYSPVYMDGVLSGTIWETVMGQYKQLRRWGWGVEHFPYMVVSGLKDRKVNWWIKVVETYNILEGHFSWATASLFLMLVGWYPFLVNSSFSQSPLSFYVPMWAERLLQFALLGLFVSMYVSLMLLPPKPPKYGWWGWVEMILMWAAVPVTASFFGSLPALESQTRMMLGGKFRLGFYVTKKVVKK